MESLEKKAAARGLAEAARLAGGGRQPERPPACADGTGQGADGTGQGDAASQGQGGGLAAGLRPPAQDKGDAAEGQGGGAPQGQGGGKPPEVFGDVSVCRALRIRRRVLAAARTKESRGRDWDCVGLHAGMTWDWIARKAVELHVTPDLGRLVPIAEGDGVVSCTLAAVVLNPQRVVADVVATGERRVAWVRDSSLMRLREAFDCIDDHGVLSARADLNDCVY